MPEGDTIARSAARLRAALDGTEVVGVSAPRWAGALPEAGERIVAVESVGKHLLISFSGGLVLRTHMRMTGSWHLYRPGERWRRPRHEMRVMIATATWEAVCFVAPEVAFSRVRADGAGGVRSLPVLAHLGPDLCRADADLDDCVRRFDLVPAELTIAEALADQRICCGVGNVFKSEICWAERLDPFTPVGAVSPRTRAALVATAARQLLANLGPGPRTTVPEGLAVYGRVGRECRRCGAVIRVRRHGVHARSTYWCPGCQLPDPDQIGQ